MSIPHPVVEAVRKLLETLSATREAESPWGTSSFYVFGGIQLPDGGYSQWVLIDVHMDGDIVVCIRDRLSDTYNVVDLSKYQILEP